MPQNKRRVILERRSKIAEMYLRGVAQYIIADELNISTSQVSRDLKKLAQQWRESALVNIDEVKAKELAKIDKLEKEYYDAWVRSCQMKTKKSAKKKRLTTAIGKALGVDSKEQTFTEEQMIGNPRFLEGVRWCIAKREEIFGYAAAKKIDVKSDGKPLQGGSVIILPSNGREIVENVPESNE